MKSFVQERHQYSRYNAEISGSLHLGMRVAVASGVFNGVLSGFTTLVFTAIIYYGVGTWGWLAPPSHALQTVARQTS